MSKPEDSPQDVWEAAKEAIEPWLGPTHQYRLDCQEGIARAIQAAVAAEREACAKVADDMWGDGPHAEYDNGATQDGWNVATRAITLAIRARSQP